MARWFAIFVGALLAMTPARAQTVVEIQTGIAGAKFVPIYSSAERANVFRRLVGLSSPAVLGAPVSLTPNSSYAPDGSHLSFWKPSFVIGTPDGGEAGINFWGKFQDGHVNVAFMRNKPVLLDCRMLSAGPITYKIYTGGGLTGQGETPLRDGHFLLAVAVSATPISVELWPTPGTQAVGFFGCEISTIEKGVP